MTIVDQQWSGFVTQVLGINRQTSHDRFFSGFQTGTEGSTKNGVTIACRDYSGSHDVKS